MKKVTTAGSLKEGSTYTSCSSNEDLLSEESSASDGQRHGTHRFHQPYHQTNFVDASELNLEQNTTSISTHQAQSQSPKCHSQDDDDDDLVELDIEGHDPGIEGTETNLETRDGRESTNLFQKLGNECVAMCCPCLLLIRALCRCDMDLFWSLCSSVFAIKAMWSSVMSLGLCTLFKVHRIIPDIETNGSTNITEAYLFGLWTYTDKIKNEDHSLEGLVEEEIERIETCRFDMRLVDEDAPDDLFLNDAPFTTARVFVILAVGLGAISIMAVLLNAANMCKSFFKGPRRWVLPVSLLICSISECFIFLILASSVCWDTKYQEHRQCSLQADSGIAFAAIFSWFITSIASAKKSLLLDNSNTFIEVPRNGAANHGMPCTEIQDQPPTIEIT